MHILRHRAGLLGDNVIGSLAPQAWLCWPLGIKRAAVLMAPAYRALEGSPKEGGQFAHKSGQLGGHTPRQKLQRYAHESSAQTRNTVYIRICTRRKDTRMTVANTYRSLTRLNRMSTFNLQKQSLCMAQPNMKCQVLSKCFPCDSMHRHVQVIYM